MKFAILSVVLTLAGVAYAGEEKIEIKDLPKPVRAAVQAKFPEAKVTGAVREEADGKTVYEVTVKEEGQEENEETVLSVSTKGKTLEVEKSISAKKLPKAVRATLEARYPKAKIKKAEEVVKYDDGEKKFFEVVLATSDREEIEVKLSRKGKVLDDGDDEEDDDDDKKSKDDKGEKEQGKKKDKD